MTLFDDTQDRREVEHLHHLAMDANDEGQYATMERLLEQAVATAQRLQDLPLLIEERFWFASAQRMQGKHTQALTTYTWLIGVATDPTSSREVTDEDSLWYLANAFMNFISSGRDLPEMPVSLLLRVVADGQQWVALIGKPHWSAGFRNHRGVLLQKQGDLQGARLELEAAVALGRRYPDAPGYTLASYQMNLADVLGNDAIKAYPEAIALTEEVLSASESDTYDRWLAYRMLAYTRLAMGEREAVLIATQESLSLALAMESPSPVCMTYALLGRIHREAGQMREAATAVMQEWRWARRVGAAEYRNNALTNCARVRLLQAREACGLPAQWGTLPEQLPMEANRSLATRYLHSARHLLGWAQPLSAKLDQASGTRSFQDDLDSLYQEIDQLVTLLKAEII